MTHKHHKHKKHAEPQSSESAWLKRDKKRKTAMAHIKARKYTPSVPSDTDVGIVKVSSSAKLPWKFLYTSHDNRLHNVQSDGSEYHINHIVNNPHKFNLDEPEIKDILTKTEQHADFGYSNPESFYKAIQTGEMDVAPYVQSVAMHRGMVRGYMYDAPDSFIGEMDHSNPEHMKHFLHHIMPRLEHHAKQGNEIEIRHTGGRFTDIKQIKKYVGGGKQEEKPQEAPRQSGPMPERIRTEIKNKLRKGTPKQPGMSNYEAQKAIEKLTGTWGDSVEPKQQSKTFKELQETIRKVGSQWRLVSHTGKNLGTFNTKHEAHVREGQVKGFAARDKK